MQAMRLLAPGTPLRLCDVALPAPGPQQLLIRVEACGVCRTDLHILDNELPDVRCPLTPGHEVVGVVAASGSEVREFVCGDRVGVPWLGFTCGECFYCRAGQENLCVRARFTGYTLEGGYAHEMLADARYCLALPQAPPAASLAPLLCAGLIGHRAYRKAAPAERLGLYGFGAAAHLVAQVARHEGGRIFAFTRPGDHCAQQFARSLGAYWAGGSDERAPQPLDAAIIFAPVGGLVPAALSAVRPGGRVICAGIHMSDIPGFAYELLWGERTLASVANLTRADGQEFMALATRLQLSAHVERFALPQANVALERLRHGQLNGAAVLDMSHGERVAVAGAGTPT
jgi:alcohol dehydrogenase, propanol-preferring